MSRAGEKAGQDISARLGSVRRVLVRRRRYLLDGKPVEFATSYLYARLEELGHHLDHFEEEIRARMPSPTEGKTPWMASGVPVSHLIRTA